MNIDLKVQEYQAQREILIKYLESKLKQGDFHGVRDCAADIEILDAEFRGIGLGISLESKRHSAETLRKNEMANKAVFVKYSSPETPSIEITVQVLPEPDGDYSIMGGYVKELRGGAGAHLDFVGSLFSKVLRKMNIEESEVRLVIEDALAKKEERIL